MSLISMEGGGAVHSRDGTYRIIERVIWPSHESLKSRFGDPLALTSVASSDFSILERI